MWQDAQVVILSTNNKSDLYLYKGVELIHKTREHIEGNWTYQNQHIYILYNEEIKEGDWKYNVIDKSITQQDGGFCFESDLKIIATTDPSLVIEGKASTGDIVWRYPFPKPSIGFINELVAYYNAKVPIIDVKVEYEFGNISESYFDGEKERLPLILKINQTDNTINIKL